LWSLHQVGERITPIGLTVWKNLIVQMNDLRAHRRQPSVTSFVELSFEDWMAHARSAYAHRYDRLPGKSFGRNYEHVIDRIRRAVAIQYHEREWWRADRWDPVHDQRIPRRTHQTNATATIDWADVEPAWLREGGQWWLATLLKADRIAWTSVIAYKTALAAHVAPFLRARGVDHPKLVVDPAIELRAFCNDLLGHLRTKTINRGRHKGKLLNSKSVSGVQTVLNSFYGFMFDHRAEAARLLNDPRWHELGESHLMLWPPRERSQGRRPRRAEPDYLEPEVLSQITAHVDLLGLPPDQSREVVVAGEHRSIAGLGEPQAMRAYLLIILTGRRMNEILMLDPDPIEPLLTPDGPPTKNSADAAGGVLVARLRYQQTKIDGAPNTIPVEQAVVNLIREQQQWVREQVIPRLSRDEAGCAVAPKCLFVATQRNQRGLKPYHPAGLGQRLAKLANEFRLTDSQGRLVDFQRTHRMRHTKATYLINAGVPLHVVQRYLGHLSPEMTLWYGQTLWETQEREFLRLAKIGIDGREKNLDPRALLDTIQLENRTDRVLPNGYCLLPPLKRCEKGNACLTCGDFATDRTFLDEPRRQRDATLNLITVRKDQHLTRTGRPVTDDNVWLAGRLAELDALDRVIASVTEKPVTEAVQGAGINARLAARAVGQPRQPLPIAIDTSRMRHR
jgi:integrase